jgi:hypothetical protein
MTFCAHFFDDLRARRSLAHSGVATNCEPPFLFGSQLTDSYDHW